MSDLAVITGTTRGLGRAVAGSFAQAGWRVQSISRPDYELARIDGDRVDILFSQLVGNTSGRAVLILNAASLHIESAKSQSAEVISKSISENIAGNITLCSIFLRHFKYGEIVNITSGAARNGISHWSLYCAAKAAMEGYMRALASEDVKTYVIDPGLIDTRMQMQIRESVFPDHNRFVAFKAAGALQSPEAAAKIVTSQIIDPSATDHNRP